jgi:anhydro-N-acetylmuramic acid kinase
MSQWQIIVGLMSGTSLDGIDAVLLRAAGSGLRTRFEQLAYTEVRFPEAVRTQMLRNSIPETSRVDEITRLNVLLGQLYAEAVNKVARLGGKRLSDIDLIGSHGQTIHHLPNPVRLAGRMVRATLQIGDPSVLATLTGIPTVGNFRVADMAAGGEGAPLIPYFDWLVFRSRSKGRLLLNIGGISNITLLPRLATVGDVVAFDTGPGNMLVDALTQKFFGQKYDVDGEIAAGGRCLPGLLRGLMKHPYVRRRPPKSTGREEFGDDVIRWMLRMAKGAKHADIVRTAAEFTPLTVYDACRRFLPGTTRIDEVIVSGGGARNRFFLSELRRLFSTSAIRTSDEFGLSGDAKEAICFAILANETMHGNCTNLPRVTGANKRVVLGTISKPAR